MTNTKCFCIEWIFKGFSQEWAGTSCWKAVGIVFTGFIACTQVHKEESEHLSMKEECLDHENLEYLITLLGLTSLIWVIISHAHITLIISTMRNLSVTVSASAVAYKRGQEVTLRTLNFKLPIHLQSQILPVSRLQLISTTSAFIPPFLSVPMGSPLRELI